jgi:hypothetical protein
MELSVFKAEHVVVCVANRGCFQPLSKDVW